MTIDRNDPCPCGSGKKFKKCCFGKASDTDRPFGTDQVFREIREALKGQSFGSLEEVNAFVSRHMEERNRKPIDDFDGLSPEQMGHFLHFPFDSPDIVTYPDVLAIPPTAPILVLFDRIVRGIDSPGLKATATGNLPRAFCREAAEHYMGDERYREYTRFGGINSEPNFPDLHATRIVSEEAGLLKKYRGKFTLGKECRAVIAAHGVSGIFPLLFRAYVTKFNWGYRDRYPELRIIQQSFPFTLYLLARHGAEWRPHTFYEDAFLRAFPMILQGWEHGSIFPPEETVRSCYTCRSMERFAAFFGLVELDPIGEKWYEPKFRVRKHPLLDAAVKFHVKV